ncbi:hypothetical protein QWZ13_15055 [Reinekea marina]|uniref:hypothetical protein n=1 Tax=Reinekea marina TaxID=1310421 RepID=UPI0025B556F5|nr:hypothetical protein [Reinekea marina]MDN3647552.1 hypothetical protein [Reinekea marina]MDN3648301.1 hypothetical protein [Reinekea marina]MDN3648529.1 hypothetical protein [Reinekea marina]MDN3649969.1 hypothetical protein [Reinekea marina]MDN3650236.1 hypothetical protein [Reinekea marina]
MTSWPRWLSALNPLIIHTASKANARVRVRMSRSDLSHHPINLSFATEVKGNYFLLLYCQPLAGVCFYTAKR